MTRFAELYVQLCKSREAAIQAGYSPKTADSQASQLLRHPKVQALIQAKRINKAVHADKTYEQMIQVVNASLKVLIDAMNREPQDKETWDSIQFARIRAIEAAGHQIERIARMEGLLLPPAAGNGDTRNFLLQQINVQMKSDPERAKTIVDILKNAKVFDRLERGKGSGNDGNGTSSKAGG